MTAERERRSGSGGARDAVIGLGWMGEVHARAFARLLPHHCPGDPLRPRLVAGAGSEPTRREPALADDRTTTGCDDLKVVEAERLADAIVQSADARGWVRP
jgi:hypothetical protein